jgi:two-component system, NtrC family, nitrogen regulation response regulator GlnG
VPDLVRHFFDIAESEGLTPKRINQPALDLLKRHLWPGNVRELENLVRRLSALYPQDEITADIIEQELRSEQGGFQPAGTRNGSAEDVTISHAVEGQLQAYFASFKDSLPPPGIYSRFLAEFEYPLILACLTATNGNQIRAAELLGLNRNTLRKKIRELGISIFRSTKPGFPQHH